METVSLQSVKCSSLLSQFCIDRFAVTIRTANFYRRINKKVEVRGFTFVVTFKDNIYLTCAFAFSNETNKY